MSRILIVEDDPLILRMYQSVFKFEHHEVAVARNGEEGLERIKADKPTLILLDIMMPKMTGIDVLRVIKSNPETKNIPVIVLTNLSGDQDVQLALELGAVKFIVKSEFKPKQVVAAVEEILKATNRDEVPNVG